jgi:hypothetical protein
MGVLEHTDSIFVEQRIHWFHLRVGTEPFTSGDLFVKLHELVLHKFTDAVVYNFIVGERLFIAIVQHFACPLEIVLQLFFYLSALLPVFFLFLKRVADQSLKVLR